MGWIVKSWHHEERAREIVAAAERDARRSGRAAARETADATAYLTALEAFGEETRRAVRERRRALGAERGDPVATPAPVTIPVPAPATAIRARRGRATMRDSNLAELFRDTAATGSAVARMR